MENQETQKKATVVVITKGNVKVEVSKDDVITVDPTHDGVVFNFKGSQFYCTDQNMPPAAKAKLKEVINQYNVNKIVINFNTPSRLVSIEN